MIQIMRARTLRIKLDEAESRGHRKAIVEITELVASKGRVYGVPVEITGDLYDCAIIGGDPAIKMTGDRVKVTKCIIYSSGAGIEIAKAKE